MTILFVLIVLPIIILLVFAFAFQSSVTEIKKQQFIANCPYPISDGVATIVNIVDGVRLNYTVTVTPRQYASQGYNGTYFECTIDPITKVIGATASIKNYGATLFSVIPYGWYAWVGDSIGSFFNKIQPNLTILYLMFTAPAQVTGLAWFAYAQLFLLFCIGLGIFLMVRG